MAGQVPCLPRFAWLAVGYSKKEGVPVNNRTEFWFLFLFF